MSRHRRIIIVTMMLVVSGGGCTNVLGSGAGTGLGGSEDAPSFPLYEPPGVVTIRVRNDGTRPLYVQASGWSGQAVASVVGPDGVGFGTNTCEVCNCPSLPSCAVCGRGFAAVAELAPGAWHDIAWDQTNWRLLTEPAMCEQPELIAPGPLTARAAYAAAVRMEGDESYIEDPVLSAETAFEHPASDVVVVPIL